MTVRHTSGGVKPLAVQEVLAVVVKENLSL